MERAGCGQAMPILKKGKKKQVKDELDRQKQVEKKKRRLEKALANSAAIRLELEKKKQMKIEEQKRLDREGAAVAEAVALYALLGDDNGDNSHQFILDNGQKFSHRSRSRDESRSVDYRNSSMHFVGPDIYVSGYEGNTRATTMHQYLPTEMCLRGPETSYFEDTRQGEESSPGLIAALAVSSLRIAEDPFSAPFPASKTDVDRATSASHHLARSNSDADDRQEPPGSVDSLFPSETN